MINFLVVGSNLPWIANYMTYGGMLCLHGINDDLMDCPTESISPSKVSDVLLSSEVDVLGIADNRLLSHQNFLIERFPTAQWIVCNGENLPHYLATKLEELRLKTHTHELFIGEEMPLGLLRVIKDNINPNWKSSPHRHEMLRGMSVTSTGPEREVKEIEPLTSSPCHAGCLKIVKEMCGNNELAWNWLNQAYAMALTWDHLVDGDPIDYAQSDYAFKSVLVEWPNNPFLRDNARSLTPVMASAISSWQASYMDDMPKDGAYSIYGDLAAAVAFIIGGQFLVDRYIPTLRKRIREIVIEDDRKDLGKK